MYPYDHRWQGAPVAVKIMQTLGSVGVDDIVDSFLQEVKVIYQPLLHSLHTLFDTSIYLYCTLLLRKNFCYPHVCLFCTESIVICV